MQRQRVNSTNLAAIGYHDEENRLQVEFLNGSVYEYDHVPKDIYELLMTAPSHGKFFNANIKNRFPGRLIQE